MVSISLIAPFISATVIQLSISKEYGPITAHFEEWLLRKGYGKYDFARRDLLYAGSFGGRKSEHQKITRRPVIFFHGNADSALRSNNFSIGWSNTVEYFLKNGYDFAELYATSWGNNVQSEAVSRHHDCETTLRLRKFVEAVLDYTKAPLVDIIGHSMGVTLARKIIQGGKINENARTYCDLGEALNSRVLVFLAISGANYGLCFCSSPASIKYPTCNHYTGFWSGDATVIKENSAGNTICTIHNTVNGTTQRPVYSEYLMNLNRKGAPKEAAFLFSVWSLDDDLISNDDYVYGKPTSHVPHSDGSLVYTTIGHMATKDETASDQFWIISRQKLP